MLTYEEYRLYSIGNSCQLEKCNYLIWVLGTNYHYSCHLLLLNSIWHHNGTLLLLKGKMRWGNKHNDYFKVVCSLLSYLWSLGKRIKGIIYLIDHVTKNTSFSWLKIMLDKHTSSDNQHTKVSRQGEGNSVNLREKGSCSGSLIG